MKTNKLKSPQSTREFSQYEIELLKSLPYGTKTLGKSKIGMERMKFLICLLENNKPDKSGFINLPVKYLGAIFKNIEIASKIIHCAVDGGLITCNRHYSPGHFSRGYKINDSFRLINAKAFTERINMSKETNKEPKEKPAVNNVSTTEDELDELERMLFEVQREDAFRRCKVDVPFSRERLNFHIN